MENEVPHVDDYKAMLRQLLQQPTIASKEWAYKQYDSKAQGNTLVGPGSDAAVVKLKAQIKQLQLRQTVIPVTFT